MHVKQYDRHYLCRCAYKLAWKKKNTPNHWYNFVKIVSNTRLPATGTHSLKLPVALWKTDLISKQSFFWKSDTFKRLHGFIAEYILMSVKGCSLSGQWRSHDTIGTKIGSPWSWLQFCLAHRYNKPSEGGRTLPKRAVTQVRLRRRADREEICFIRVTLSFKE